MTKVATIEELHLENERILMRVDFNVPLDEKGEITDDTRISAAIPSIRYALNHGASVVLLSHLGRPKGEVKPGLSLAPCAKRLSELLGVEVKMAPDCIGPKTLDMAKNLKPGEVLLLENLRFHAAEEYPEKDASFARQLAEMGTVYINDAFGTAHRAHSSIVPLAKYFPGNAAAGFLLVKEVEFLGQHLSVPTRPFCAIIGGAKISTKIGVIQSLIPKLDTLIIGGGMSYTFFKVQGYSIGNSIYEPEYIDMANEIIGKCMEQNVNLVLPVDIVVADSFSNDAHTKVVNMLNEGIEEGYEGMDIGPESVEMFKGHLAHAKTIFWNGPLGVFEFPHFAKGTEAIAHALEHMRATKIVGGGDSIAALKAVNAMDKMTHVSTGGGAAMEYIEQGTLPGIEVLKSQPSE